MYWYFEIDSSFANTRKPQMIQHIEQLIEEGDEEKFHNAVKEYTRQGTLPPNTKQITTMLEEGIVENKKKIVDDFS